MPLRAEPGEFTGVAPDHRRAGRIDRARERRALFVGDRLDQRSPMRPPAPATISRMPDIDQSPGI